MLLLLLNRNQCRVSEEHVDYKSTTISHINASTNATPIPGQRSKGEKSQQKCTSLKSRVTFYYYIQLKPSAGKVTQVDGIARKL